MIIINLRLDHFFAVSYLLVSLLTFLLTLAVPCTYFEAPAYGVRSCNTNTSDSNGVLYEMVCVIQCTQGYSFADPTAANTYLCQSDGTWQKLLFGGQFPQAVYPKSQRPWPDCARK